MVAIENDAMHPIIAAKCIAGTLTYI